MTFRSRSISWDTTSQIMSLDGVFMAYMMVKKMVDLSQTVFVRSNNEAFKQARIAHMHMDIFQRMQWAWMQCVAFRLKIILCTNIPWHILAKGSPPQLLTPLNVVIIGIIRPLCDCRGRAYCPEGSSILCTCQCIRFRSLTLKMKVTDIDDLNETWHAKEPCQRAYVCTNCHFYVQLFVCST